MEIKCCSKTCEEFSICPAGQAILKEMAEKERPLCPFQSYNDLRRLQDHDNWQHEAIKTLHEDLENARDNAIQLEKIIDSMKVKLPCLC